MCLSTEITWNDAQHHYERLAAKLLSALPLRPRVDGQPNNIRFIEIDDADEDAAFYALTNSFNDVTAYVRLELPKCVQHAISANIEDGPSLRLTRLFVPFPETGSPRMVTYIHVGVND